MARRKHPDKDLEKVLKDAEAQGWRIKDKNYFKMYCPCPGKHLKSVHLTPSDPNYLRNLLKKLLRDTCWKE